MKIGYLISQYPAVNHTFILREIRCLRSRGFDISIISIRPADRPFEKLTPEEQDEQRQTVSVMGSPWTKIAAALLATLCLRPAGFFRGFFSALRMGRFHPAGTLRHLLYFAEAVTAGHWMLAREISHFHTHFSSTVGLLMVRIFPLAMSITIHGPAEFDDPIGFQLPAKVEASKFVCTISQFGRSQLMKICDASQWSKVEVSRLGVDPRVFEPKPFREAPEMFEAVCVARLAPVKAQRILIDAVHELNQAGRKLKLHLAGDGPDRRMLEAHAKSLGLSDLVIFHGSLNQDAVQALYRRSDMFGLASFAEGIPVVLMEAMAMEIPCVATFVCGVPELIQDGENGLLVPASDTGALVQALARVMDDPALRKRLGIAARKKVIEDFDLAKNTAQLAEIFQRRLSASDQR